MFPSVLSVCHLFTIVDIIDIPKSIDKVTSYESTIDLLIAFYTLRGVCIPVEGRVKLDPSVCTHVKIRTPPNGFSWNLVWKNVTKNCRVIQIVDRIRLFSRPFITNSCVCFFM
jgi:hypothetical protein